MPRTQKFKVPACSGPVAQGYGSGGTVSLQPQRSVRQLILTLVDPSRHSTSSIPFSLLANLSWYYTRCEDSLPFQTMFKPTRPLYRARRRLQLTTKQVGAGYYKGNRTGSMGDHTRWGGYIIDWTKVRTYVPPDRLDVFKVGIRPCRLVRCHD